MHVACEYYPNCINEEDGQLVHSPGGCTAHDSAPSSDEPPRAPSPSPISPANVSQRQKRGSLSVSEDGSPGKRPRVVATQKQDF